MFNTVPIVNNNVLLKICQEGLSHVKSSYHSKTKERKCPGLKKKPFTWMCIADLFIIVKT